MKSTLRRVCIYTLTKGAINSEPCSFKGINAKWGKSVVLFVQTSGNVLSTISLPFPLAPHSYPLPCRTNLAIQSCSCWRSFSIQKRCVFFLLNAFQNILHSRLNEFNNLVDFRESACSCCFEMRSRKPTGSGNIFFGSIAWFIIPARKDLTSTSVLKFPGCFSNGRIMQLQMAV